MKKLVLMFALLFSLMQGVVFSQGSGYKISGKIDIGGQGWWDYESIDPQMNRLYVSHADKVHIIDLKNNRVIGEIEGLNGVHGIVFDDKSGKGFISNGRNDTVSVFDLKSLKVTNNIYVTGKDPDAIVFDPFTKRVFTMNGRGNNVTVIDAKTDSILGTIKLEGTPEFAVLNGKGSMFVNIEEKNQVAEFNTETLEIIKTWSVAPGDAPSGLAIDIKNNILFSGCRNKMMVISNAGTGKVITTVPIGGHVDGCGFDPDTHLIFSSNGEGSLTVIKEESPEKFIVLENIKTEKGLRTMALDPATHNIYLPGKLDNENFGVLILKKE